MLNKVTASIVVIGNEILSGRTQDVNVQSIAKFCARKGIYLQEVRIIEDNKNSIISTVNQLRSNYDYVFTTGGIGPTHDDITSESIAEAFGLKIEINPEARIRLEEYYQSKNRDILDVHMKMAMIPIGAKLIDNALTAAPGFIVENIYVVAGVPAIVENMLEYLDHIISSNDTILSESITLMVPESFIAKEMEQIEKDFPDIAVGSYPFTQNDKPATNIVFRSSNKLMLDDAIKAFKKSTQSISK